MGKTGTSNRLLVYFFIPALFCLLVVPYVRASEPSYNGKPLSEWLLLNSNPSAAEHLLPAGAPSPAEAIHQIGTNGIPIMIEILSVKKSDKGWELMRLKSPDIKRIFSGSDANLDDLRSIAVDGFAVLGTNAESAVPQLARLFHNRNNDQYFFQTIRALNKVGPKGFAVLTNAMNDPDDSVRNNLIWVLGEEGGSDPKIVTQLLIKALKDPDPVNRGDAAEFLAGKDPSAISPLIELLDSNHTNYITVNGAAKGLAGYGAAAKDAAPILLSIFTNEVMNLDRQSAHTWTFVLMQAMGAIDKDTAAKADAFVVNLGPLGASFGYATTLLPNGKELLVGGWLPANPNHVTSKAMLFDLATGKWTETGSMNVGRYGQMAVLLSNGKVLVVGGCDRIKWGKGDDLISAELYDPKTGKWMMTGSMHSPHPSERMALQHDGKVLVYEGGFDSYPIRGHELYDPATGTWTVVANK